MKGTTRSHIHIIAVGLAMGAAEVIPGISGGTIALVAGVYERLVRAISRLRYLLDWRAASMQDTETPGNDSARNIPPVLNLANFLRQRYHSLDMTFLLLLFGAMLASILSLAEAIGYLIDHQPVLLWAFFFGLVTASLHVIGKRLNLRLATTHLALVAGLLFGALATLPFPVTIEPSPLAWFLGGSLAVCAWILPGVSGSYLLLVLGLYPSLIRAITTLDLSVLLYLGLGCLLGLALFSQLLNLLLARFHNATLATLTGFVVGSMPVLWPWKYSTSHQLLDDGSRLPLNFEMVLPGEYEQLTGDAAQLPLALIAMLAGVALLVLLDRFALLAEVRQGKGHDEQG